jgi:hypothetical protein
MNWWDRRLCGSYIKLGLIIPLLALILFSCEEPGIIGEELIPGSDTVGVFAVDLPIMAGTVKQDSIDAIGELLFGDYNDPVFGRMYAESYTSLIPTTIREIPEINTAVFDSITLKLKVNYMYGSNIYFPQDLKVYQLDDSLARISIIQTDGLNDTIMNVPNTDIKQDYHRLLADTSLYINDIDPFKRDSIFFNIRLDQEFGQEIFNRAKDDPTTFTALDRIDAFLKGLAFVPGQNTSAIFGFDVASTTNSNVTLHYHTATDTLAYTFGMNFRRYNYIQGDRSGTELADLNVDEIFYPASGRIYGQAGTGITPFIDVSSILQLKESVGTFIINNAMLYIEVEPYSEDLYPPGRLNLYVADSLGHPAQFSRGDTLFHYYTLNVTDGSGGQLEFLSQPGSPPAFINFLPDKRRYMIDLTLFLQGMMNGSNQFKKIVLYPYTTLDQFGLVHSLPRVDRFVVDTNKIKLRVFYTTIR